MSFKFCLAINRLPTPTRLGSTIRSFSQSSLRQYRMVRKQLRTQHNSVGSRGRQPQELFDEVVHHELGGNDHSDVDQSRVGAPKELGETAPPVNVADDGSKVSGRAA